MLDDAERVRSMIDSVRVTDSFCGESVTCREDEGPAGEGTDESVCVRRRGCIRLATPVCLGD